ncbi:MAG: sterol desaturase family protein [Thermoanaerobaculia bacterium]
MTIALRRLPWANFVYFLLYASGVYGLVLWPPVTAVVIAIAEPVHRLVVHEIERVPLIVRCVAAFIAFDCAAYWMHRAAHRSTFLWRFHRVHHSDPELGPLTTFRFHVVEIAWRMAMQFAPLYLLSIAVAIPPAMFFGLVAFDMVAHSDAGWTFGPIGRCIVSPAYHAVHHGREEYANFGMFLVVWDAMFKTRGNAHCS